MMEHNPGSKEAVALGCSCPIYDNSDGVGYQGFPGLWVFRSDCPYHYPPEAQRCPCGHTVNNHSSRKYACASCPCRRFGQPDYEVFR